MPAFFPLFLSQLPILCDCRCPQVKGAVTHPVVEFLVELQARSLLEVWQVLRPFRGSNGLLRVADGHGAMCIYLHLEQREGSPPEISERAMLQSTFQTARHPKPGNGKPSTLTHLIRPCIITPAIRPNRPLPCVYSVPRTRAATAGRTNQKAQRRAKAGDIPQLRAQRPGRRYLQLRAAVPGPAAAPAAPRAVGLSRQPPQHLRFRPR